jgi:membrane-bound serine protease (ClpP class)
METIIDPNVAYLLLLAGLMLGILGMLTPGTGFFEIGSIFSLLLAGYAVYTLDTSPWALLVLALSVIPFIYAMRAPRPRREIALMLSVLGFLGGSVFLFVTPEGAPAVNLILAAVVSLMFGSIIWFATQKTLEAVTQQPHQSPDRIINQIGEARTRVHTEGSAQIAGELWSVKSEKPIANGSKVRVIAREGLILTVEKAD